MGMSRNVLLLLIFTFQLLVILLLWKYPYMILQNHHILRNNNGQFSNQIQSAINIYRQLQKNYRKSLAVIPQPSYMYNTNKNHVTLGPSIQSPSDSRVKRVLVWTKFFNYEWVPDIMCKGQEKYCIKSTDKGDLLKSDAVLFHPFNIRNLPEHRLPEQRWVYCVWEAPKNVLAIFQNAEDYSGIFNWTSTYRWDSDFPTPYYRSAARKNPLDLKQYKSLLSEIMRKKTRLVAALISNCNTFTTQRIKFIEKLKLYIQLDFYGSCGDMECGSSEQCREQLSKYKFYLSFENSNCRDYITEKVRTPLHTYNAVPIVMGGGHPSDYDKIMPPMSYIHSKGFESAKELAEYLKFLDANPVIYERYHKWRQTHEQMQQDYFCDMCQALHNNSFPSKVYTDLKGWFDEDVCKSEYILLFSTMYVLTLSGICFLLFFSMLYCKKLYSNKALGLGQHSALGKG